MNKELRERFEKIPHGNPASPNGDYITYANALVFLESAEQEIIEAERRMKASIREKAEKLKKEITICQCGPREACDKCPRQKDVSYNFALEHLIQSL